MRAIGGGGVSTLRKTQTSKGGSSSSSSPSDSLLSARLTHFPFFAFELLLLSSSTSIVLSPDVGGIFLLRFCFFGGSSVNP